MTSRFYLVTLSSLLHSFLLISMDSPLTSTPLIVQYPTANNSDNPIINLAVWHRQQCKNLESHLEQLNLLKHEYEQKLNQLDQEIAIASREHSFHEDLALQHTYIAMNETGSSPTNQMFATANVPEPLPFFAPPETAMPAPVIAHNNDLLPKEKKKNNKTQKKSLPAAALKNCSKFNYTHCPPSPNLKLERPTKSYRRRQNTMNVFHFFYNKQNGQLELKKRSDT